MTVERSFGVQIVRICRAVFDLCCVQELKIKKKRKERKKKNEIEIITINFLNREKNYCNSGSSMFYIRKAKGFIY